MPVRGLVSHIDLNVSDPTRSIPFYGRVLEHLGFERAWVEPPEGRVTLEDVQAGDRCGWHLRYADGAVLGIEVRPPALPPPRRAHERYAPGLDHLALHAASRADVDELHAVLVAAGVIVAEPPREYDYAPGYYAVAFDDPDGVRLEVVHDPTTNPSG
jgi:catechol 2,3-dioxygenase-like lactoylglutathione lyase family enzyme